MPTDEIVATLKALREQKKLTLANLKSVKAAISEKSGQARALRYELKELKAQYKKLAADKKQLNSVILTEQVKFAKVL